jgi:hypothetical protein
MSRSLTQNFLAPPKDAKAALYFLEGNYQFNYREGSVEKTKFLTPSQIGKAFAVKDVFDSGWIDQRVLRFALLAKKRHKILSVLPAEKRKILITDPRSADEREMSNETTREMVLELEVPLPSLLLLGIGRQYYLWATLEKTITPASKICAAPFPNLDKSGGICFGGNFAPECCLETIESVWQMIFDSPFNNHQMQNRTLTHKEDARKFLLEISGKKTFPKNALIKTEYSVNDLWHSVS